MTSKQLPFGLNKLCLMLVLSISIFIFSCDKEESTPSNPMIPGGGDVALRHYDASAAIGDVISIVVDENKNTISYDNITTGETGKIPFVRVNAGVMRGALRIVIDNEDFYLLEIPNQLIMTYLPVGANIEMVVGVKSSNYTPGDHVGSWIFFGYEPHPNDENYWGFTNVYDNGRYDLDIWNFSGQVVHTETGDWEMDSINPSIIYSMPDGTTDIGTETMYVLPEKLRIYDSGPQMGMGIGLAEPDQPLTISDITGKYVASWTGGYGSFEIKSDGVIKLQFYDDGQLYTDEYTDLRRTTPADAIHFNNTFYFTDHLMPGSIQDVYVIMLPGDAFLAVYYDPYKGMLTSMAVRVDR